MNRYELITSEVAHIKLEISALEQHQITRGYRIWCSLSRCRPYNRFSEIYYLAALTRKLSRLADDAIH
jgi:hypothetical protein